MGHPHRNIFFMGSTLAGDPEMEVQMTDVNHINFLIMLCRPLDKLKIAVSALKLRIRQHNGKAWELGGSNAGSQLRDKSGLQIMKGPGSLRCAKIGS